MRRLWIAGLLITASFVAGTHAVSAGQTHAKPVIVYRVEAGDTLWTIAEKLAPQKDPREVVDGLMKSSHLGSPTIIPGQTLLYLAP